METKTPPTTPQQQLTRKVNKTMTTVPQNRKYHTTFGYIKNNNTLHQIQRYNVTLFNFSISNIDITTGTLSVICDTVTDEQIIYTLDLEDDKATLSTDIYNYCVGGTVEMFLSVVWCLYRDVMEIEYDDEPVDPTDERILLLQARIEQLTADLEAAQSSGGSGGLAPSIIVLDTIDCENISYASFLGGYYNGKIGIGAIQFDLGATYPQISSEYTSYISGLIEVDSCIIGETELTVTPNFTTDGQTKKVLLTLNVSGGPTVDYDDTPLPVVTTIVNKANDTTYTVEDTLEVNGNTVTFSNGGGY